MKKAFFVLMVITLMMAITVGAAGAAPKVDVQPILKMDTGGHMALIRKIAVTKDGRHIVSASDDKTIRVWDAATRKETRKILGQIGGGMEGMIYAVALSPDDRWLAVGGFFNYEGNLEWGNIRIYDFATGRIKAILKSHENVVMDLAFSPDGRYLVSGSQDKTVRVWEMKQATEGGGQPFKIFREHTNSVYAVRIFPHGSDYRVVSAADDNKVILYSLNQGRAINTFSHKIMFGSLAVTQAAGRGYIASAGYDKKINIFDLDLNHIKTIDSETRPAGLAFSSDGGLLLAGFGFDYRKATDVCSTYDSRNNFRKVASNTLHDNLTQAVAFLDANTAVTGGGNNYDIYLWDPRTGKELMHIVGGGKAVWSVGIRGEEAAFGNIVMTYMNEQAKLEKSFRLDTFAITALSGSYKRIPTTWNGYSLTHAKGGDYGYGSAVLAISRDGSEAARVVRGSTDGYRHNTYGFTNDGVVISGGSSGFLSAYDTTGRKLADFIGHAGEVWGIAVDGDRLVSGSYDQTIRVWDLQELRRVKSDGGKIYPVISLFVAGNDEWVAWTEEGFFNASKNGARFIGYHINRGPDMAAEFVAVDRLYNQFYRPDLVEAKLKGKDISVFAKAVNIGEILDKGGLPPVVRLTTTAGTSKLRDTEIAGVICDQGGGIGDVTLFLNDMPVVVDTGGRGLKIVSKGPKEGGESTGVSCRNFSHTVSLTDGENIIGLMAKNKVNTIESNRAAVTIAFRSGAKERPDLYVLAVAVNKYRDGDLRLKYPIPDADDLVKSIQKGGKRLFGKVVIKTIYDDAATREGLELAFQEVGKQTKRDDVFILFLAGHGITYEKDGNYYFLPVDFRFTGEDAIQKQGVSKDDLMKNLTHIQAMKSLLLLDTCNSGSFAEAIASRNIVEKTAVARLSRATGRSTIVASSKDQVALEGYEGHGVFTYTLLQGMAGAAKDREGKVTVSGLATYIEEVLPKLTYKKWGYEQIPQKSLQGMDFPLSLE